MKAILAFSFFGVLAACQGGEPTTTGVHRALATITQDELLAGASTHVPASFNAHVPGVGAIDTRVNKVMFHPRQCEVSEGGAGIFRCPLAEQLPSYFPGGLVPHPSKVEVRLNGVCFDLYSGQLSGTSYGPQVFPLNFEGGDNFNREPYVYGPWNELDQDESQDSASPRFGLSGILWILRVPTHCPGEGAALPSRPAWNGVLLQYMHHSGGLDTPPFFTYLAHFDEFDLLRRGFAYFSMSASNVAPRDTNPNNDLHLQLAAIATNRCLPLPAALPLRPDSCQAPNPDPALPALPGLPYTTRTLVTGQTAGVFVDPFIYRDTVRVMKNLLHAVTGREAVRTIALTRSASGGLSMVMAAAQAPRNLFYACGAREICDDPTSPRVYDAFLNMSASFPMANFMHLDGTLNEPLSLPLVFYDGFQTGNNNPTALIFAREADLAGIHVGDLIKNYTAIENLPHSPGDENFATRFNGGRFAMQANGTINPSPSVPGNGVGRQMKWLGQNIFERAPLAISPPDPDLGIDVARQAAYHTALLYQLLAFLDRGEPMPRSNWDEYHARAALPASIPTEDVVGPEPSFVARPGYGNALDLDGELGFAQVASHPDLHMGVGQDFTAMMWFRTTSPPVFGGIAPLLGTFPKGVVIISGIRLFIQPDGTVLSVIRDTEGRRGTVKANLRAVKPVTDGAWHHVALVRRAGVAQQLYLDGLLADSQGDNTQNLDSGNPLLLGLHTYRYFRGQMDDTRLFRSAKTPAQILAYATAAAPPAVSDELIYFSLDGADGNVLANLGASGALHDGLVNTHLCSDPFDEDKVCAGAPEAVADLWPRNPWDEQMKFPPAPLACFTSPAARRSDACLCFTSGNPAPCATTITRDVSLTLGPFKFHQRRAINHERLHHPLDLETKTIRLPDDQVRLGFYLHVGTGQAQRRFSVTELVNGVDSVDWTGLPIRFAGYESYAAYKAALTRAVTHENEQGRYDEEGGAFDVQKTCTATGDFPVLSLDRERHHIEPGATVTDAVVGKEVAVLAGARIDEDAVVGTGSAIAERAWVGESATVGACVFVGPDGEIGHHAQLGADAIVGRGVRIGQHARIGDGCAILSAASVSNQAVLGAACRVGAGSVVSSGVLAGDHLIVGEGAHVGKLTVIGDRVTFGDRAVIGKAGVIGTFVQIDLRTRIGDHVAIGSNSQIGRDCDIGDHVTIGTNVVIGDNVSLSKGTVVPDGAVLTGT